MSVYTSCYVICDKKKQMMPLHFLLLTTCHHILVLSKPISYMVVGVYRNHVHTFLVTDGTKLTVSNKDGGLVTDPIDSKVLQTG